MSVHVFSTKKVINAINNGTFTDKDNLYYLIISQILILMVLYYAIYSVPIGLFELLSEFIAVIVITVIGLIKCNESNGGRNGDDFVYKFIILSVPLTIKITILYILFTYIQFHFLSYFKFYLSDELANIVVVTENVAVQLIYFWWMSVLISKTK